MNTIGSAHNLGALGIQRGMDQVECGAANIASADRANGKHDDLTSSLVALEEGKVQVQASAKAVQAASDLLGSLLDVLA